MEKNCFVSSLRASIDDPSLPIFETPNSVVDKYIQTIGDNTYREELLTFVTGLFENGIWSKMITFYPILGTVDKMGVNLVSDKYAINTAAATKSDNVLQLGDNSKVSVTENSDYIVSGLSTNFTVFCAQSGRVTYMLSRQNAEGTTLLNNRPALNAFAGTNNLSNFEIKWYSGESHSFSIDYAGGGNSWNHPIRLIFASTNEGIVGLKNGIKRIDGGPLSVFPLSLSPNYFDTAKLLYSCGTAYGMTEEEVVAFDALWVSFLNATSKPFE